MSNDDWGAFDDFKGPEEGWADFGSVSFAAPPTESGNADGNFASFAAFPPLSSSPAPAVVATSNVSMEVSSEESVSTRKEEIKEEVCVTSVVEERVVQSVVSMETVLDDSLSVVATPAPPKVVVSITKEITAVEKCVVMMESILDDLTEIFKSEDPSLPFADGGDDESDAGGSVNNNLSGFGGGGGGSFWEFFASPTTSESGVGALLRRNPDGPKIDDILEEDDVLEELASSPLFMDYILRQDIFNHLIQLVARSTETPSSLRHQFLACQILSFQHPSIGTAFFREEGAPLKRLLSAFDLNPPLPILGTEYSCRVLVRLLQTHPAGTVQMLQERPSSVRALFRNVGRPGCVNAISALVDACSSLVPVADQPVVPGVAVRVTKRLNDEIAQWLASISVIPELMRALLPGPDPDSPFNAVSSLQVLLAVQQKGSPLLVEMVEPVSLTLLLEALCCFSSAPLSFRAAVDLIVTIMCSESFEKGSVSSLAPEVYRAVEPLVAQLAALQSPRLGQSFYELIQLLTALILLGDPDLDKVLGEAKILEILVGVVLRFPKHNILQSTCSHIFSAALKRPAFLSIMLEEGTAGALLRRLAQTLQEWPFSPDRGFLIGFAQNLLSLRDSVPEVQEFFRRTSHWNEQVEAEFLRQLTVQAENLCGISAEKKVIKVQDADGRGPVVVVSDQVQRMLQSPEAKRIETQQGEELENRFSEFMSSGQEQQDEDFTAPVEQAQDNDGFGDFVAPVEEKAQDDEFGDFIAPVEKAKDDGFGDFVAPVEQAEDNGFGNFVAPVEKAKDDGFGDFIAPVEQSQAKQDDDFGDFVAPVDKAKDDGFGDFVAPVEQSQAKQDDGFGDFAAPAQQAEDFGDFVAAQPQTDDDFGVFVTPQSSESFGDFTFAEPQSDAATVEFASFSEEKKPEEPKQEVAPAASSGWAAFQDDVVVEAPANGLAEAEQARAVFSKVFSVFSGAKLSEDPLKSLANWKSLTDCAGPNAGRKGTAERLLMDVLNLVKPPPKQVEQPAPPSHSPSPLRLSPPIMEPMKPSTVVATPSVLIPTSAPPPIVSTPVAQPQLTDDDFGFLASFGSSSSTSSSSSSTSKPSAPSLLDDFLFSTAPAPTAPAATKTVVTPVISSASSIPVAAPMVQRDPLGALLGELNDLSFMLSDTLVVPAPKQELLFF